MNNPGSLPQRAVLPEYESYLIYDAIAHTRVYGNVTSVAVVKLEFDYAITSKAEHVVINYTMLGQIINCLIEFKLDPDLCMDQFRAIDDLIEHLRKLIFHRQNLIIKP